jgi:hypothetical protein
MSTEQQPNTTDISDTWATVHGELNSAVRALRSELPNRSVNRGYLDLLSQDTRGCNTTMGGALSSMDEVNDLTTLLDAGQEMTKYKTKLERVKDGIDNIDRASRNPPSSETVHPGVDSIRSIIEDKLRPFEREMAETWLESYIQHRYDVPVVRNQTGDDVTGWESVADLYEASKGESNVPLMPFPHMTHKPVEVEKKMSEASEYASK